MAPQHAGAAALQRAVGHTAHSHGHHHHAEADDDDHDAGDESWGHDAGSLTCQWLDELLTSQIVAAHHGLAVQAAPPDQPPAARQAAQAPGPGGPAYDARGPPRA